MAPCSISVTTATETAGYLCQRSEYKGIECRVCNAGYRVYVFKYNIPDLDLPTWSMVPPQRTICLHNLVQVSIGQFKYF